MSMTSDRPTSSRGAALLAVVACLAFAVLFGAIPALFHTDATQADAILTAL